MSLALYHPQQGYYSSSREKIGPRGDYYTSSNVHPIFGLLLARQLHQMWQVLGQPAPFTIAEMGAGTGQLCLDILNHCQERWPDFYEALSYFLAETSPALVEKQRSLLCDPAVRKRVEWVDPEVLAKGLRPITGCIFSNELIDSFPFHLVQQERGRIQEVYVTCQNDSFEEILGPPSTPAIEEYFRLYGAPLEEGQRAEVNLKALEWMEGMGRALGRGFVLTIDYGYEAAELYHPSRRGGTLLCYFRHTTSSNPFQQIGYQDITAHVNFTALMRKGEAVGLRTIGYTEQYKFLVALGLLEELENLEKSSGAKSGPDFWKNKLAMRNFLIPGGMGTLFKVLVQSRGVENPDLSGFHDPLRHPGDEKRSDFPSSLESPLTPQSKIFP